MSVWRESLGKKIRWVLLVRLIIFFAIFGASVIAGRGTPFLHKLFILYAIVVLFYLIALFFWKTTHKELSFRFLCSVLTLLEFLVEGAIIHYTGGLASPFTILLGLTVVSSALVFQLVGNLVVATTGIGVYVTLVVLEYKGILPFDPAQISPYAAALYSDGESVFFATYTFCCFLYLAAFVSGYLSEKLRARIGELELKSLQLEKIKLDTQAILTHLHSGLIAVDLLGNILYFNSAAKKLLELTGKDYEAVNIKDVLAPKFAPIIERLEALYWCSNSRDQIKEDFEFTIESQKRVYFIVFSVLRIKGTARGFLILLEDITERKKKEEYLKSLEKLAALGRLSFGLAHELRNPLASIRGSAEVLRGNRPSDTENTELLSLIVEESDRLSSILEDFLQFARIGKERKLRLFPVPLKELLNDIISQVQRHPSYNNQIEIKSELPDDELWVRGDVGSLKQVFLNILLNAVEAIEDRGKAIPGLITISSTGKVRKFDEYKDYIGITIKDTGKGIKTEQLSSIFEPMYTTKKNGVGMGLSIAQRLVNEMRGYIEVESQLGKGAMFTVFLLSD